MKVKSEREVAQSCMTLRDPMDRSLPGSSVHGIFQEVLEWGAIRNKLLSNKRHLLLGRKIMTNLDSILEKAMAPHSSTLAWKIPWMEEPGRLQSLGSLRVGHD